MSEIGNLILEYGKQISNHKPGITVEFTSNELVNQLLQENSNAFLFAVLLDQGIQAERAWAGPFELKNRIGHLDPKRIANMPLEELRSAFIEPPALHRYVDKMPLWIQLASQKLVDEFMGVAENIWLGNLKTTTVESKLRSFKGIGPKKAAMAVNLLMREKGVEMQYVPGTQVAYDIHIRRVFLRSGLCDYDDETSIQDAARDCNPADPGLLDLPTWYIGREFCRPSDPLCHVCPLTSVCKKLPIAVQGF